MGASIERDQGSGVTKEDQENFYLNDKDRVKKVYLTAAKIMITKRECRLLNCRSDTGKLIRRTYKEKIDSLYCYSIKTTETGLE